MIHSESQENSETFFMREVFKIVDAGVPIIQVRSREPVRACLAIRKAIIENDEGRHREWDRINGWRDFTKENYRLESTIGGGAGADGSGLNSFAALKSVGDNARDPASPVNIENTVVHWRVFLDLHHDINNNPVFAALLQSYIHTLPFSNVVILIITPEVPLQGIAQGMIPVVSMPTPSLGELRALISKTIEKANGMQKNAGFSGPARISPDEIDKLANLGLGMTAYEFEMHSSIAIMIAAERDDKYLTYAAMNEGIARGKTEVVKQSNVLSLAPIVDMSEVGGMRRLKDWASRRANAYSKAARDFGVDRPQGIGVVGVPGTGKSLVGKAIASVFGVPLVVFDFASVFTKFIGDSEGAVKSALKMVEDMAPCVMMVDEIDKGLGGLQGGGSDSGTSSRVLGTFLTWLQEHKADVFTIVTANRVDNLPPELFRAGRFDAIFSVAMPSMEALKEVVNIHLQKRGRNPEDFEVSALNKLVLAARGYTPAEVEQAIKNGILEAFFAEEEFTIAHAIQGVTEMIPLSKSKKTEIDRIVEWATENAINVEYGEDEAPARIPVPRPTVRRRLPSA